MKRTELATMLLSLPCDYPDCDCETKLKHWRSVVSQYGSRIDAGEEITDEEFDGAISEIVPALACMTKCPDKRARKDAIKALMNPVFAKFLEGTH